MTAPIHPYAARFPRYDEDATIALAEDIAANGLLDPITRGPDGVVYDGINRDAACELAGVEPRYVTYDGDPVPFIMSRNLQRRDLSQSQKAHLAVAGLLESNNRQEDIAKVAGVSRAHIAQAQTVAQWKPELVDQVIAGTLPHSAAYEQAQEAKESATREANQQADLKASRPDLYDLVTRGELGLIDALKLRNLEKIEDDKRRKMEQEAIRARNLNLNVGYSAWSSLMHHPDQLERAMANYQGHGDPITGPKLRQLGEFLIDLSTRWSV